ncbi:hypothetical protein XELAEV_18026807mg [Xenopus laevis]|uniref:Uncharacterized protein n=1 Tax=Xenopus laevis TaxID=8355 RepID=A0A974CWD9_XENLA|nr:hypothetical protein XELAEV_18026807mg [Xenopus laevis]
MCSKLFIYHIKRAHYRIDNAITRHKILLHYVKSIFNKLHFMEYGNTYDLYLFCKGGCKWHFTIYVISTGVSISNPFTQDFCYANIALRECAGTTGVFTIETQL